MFNASPFNTELFNGYTEVGYTAVLANVSRYRLVLYDSDAVTVLYYLPAPISASWFRRVSEASQLTLCYPSDKAASSSLIIGHWIKLFDETNNVIDSFRITARTRYFGKGYIELIGEGPLAGLADQFINEKIYLDADDWTLEEVINDLLGEQESAVVTLSLQFINASLAAQDIGERTYRRQSILEILQALVKEFGGYLLCDADGGIKWFATSTDWRNMEYNYPVTGQPKHYLRPGKDLLAATVKEDRSKMATRLYAIGAWETVHLSAPGYIEDTDAILAYGLMPRFVQNPEAKTSTELAAWANKVLAWYTTPRLEMEIEALDLTQRPASTDYRHIHLGHIIHADIADLGISYEAPIYEITVDLLKPEQIHFSMAPLDSGNGMPELAGLSQQPYPISPTDLNESTAAIAAAYDPTPTRRIEGLAWLRYTP